MIGKLRGKIDSISENGLILDVSGVGYNIHASAKALDIWRSKSNQEISLIIETIVREDHIHLYGFVSDLEKSWFHELCKVKGVGNKVALKILGILSIDDIILAVNSADKSFFSSVLGIGPKLALRIISELKDSVKKMGSKLIFSNDNKIAANNKNNIGVQNTQLIADAVSALENLGYKRAEIYSIASLEIAEHPKVTLETLITNVLRKISKK